jgi:hypothetical protein
MVDTVQSIAQLTAFFKEEREKDRVEAEKQRKKDREADKEALDVIGEDRKLLGEKKQELKDQRESLKKIKNNTKLNQEQQAEINKKLGEINKKEEELQKQFKENIKKSGEQAEKNRKDEQKRSEEARKDAAGAAEILNIQKEAIARREEQLDKEGLDASKDKELTQAKIQLLKGETELKNQGLTELQQRRNNQEANRKILEMEGRNADINKKFLKDERKLQRAELGEKLKSATSGSERKELLKEQAAKDKKSLSVFNKIELGVRGLGESFKEKFKGMASAGAGLLKKGALIALLFLLPKILNSPAAKGLVKFIQDKVIPAFKKIAGFFDKIFGEGTGGLIATLSAIGLVLYGPSVIKLLFRAARGLVGAVMSLFSSSTTALGTDSKGRGRGKGKFSKLGRLVKGGASVVGKGASVAANATATATKTVGKTIAKGAAGGASKAAGILKAGSKIGVGALKFAGPVGLAVTAGLGVFDGVQAGMESFKKDGKVGKAIQEGTAGLLSSLTLGMASQEQISGGMSKVGNFFKKRQKYGAGADDYEKVDLQADKQNQLAMNKSELLRFTQDPEAYMEEVNKGRGKGGKGKKLSPIQVRNQLLDNIKSNKRDLKDLGLGSGGMLETTGSMMDSNLMQLKTTGMTAEQIIQQGMSDRSKGIKDTAPIIINNDSSVRSNSTTNANVNETITHRDGLMVSATSDF